LLRVSARQASSLARRGLDLAQAKSLSAGAKSCGPTGGSAANPTRMDWKSLLILVARAVLQVLADELDPANRRDRPREGAPESKQAPTPPQAEARAPQVSVFTSIPPS